MMMIWYEWSKSSYRMANKSWRKGNRYTAKGEQILPEKSTFFFLNGDSFDEKSLLQKSFLRLIQKHNPGSNPLFANTTETKSFFLLK